MIQILVRGSSMRPCLRPGSLAAVEEVAPGDIRVGNIIVFQDDSGQPVMHRVISTRGGIVTQGDNLGRPDGVVEAERIVGRVVAYWRRRQMRGISRTEERLWLHAASTLRRIRSLSRAGARLLAPLLGAAVPLRRVRFTADDGRESVRLYLLKKLVAWCRTGADGSSMWIHPIFKNTAVERRVRAITTTRVGVAGLCPAEPERGRVWEPFQGSHQKDRP
jgi:signal peptidase